MKDDGHTEVGTVKKSVTLKSINHKALELLLYFKASDRSLCQGSLTEEVQDGIIRAVWRMLHCRKGER